MLLHIATPDGRTIDWTPFAPAPAFSLWWRHVYELRWLPSLLPPNATAWSRAVEAVDADLVARAPVGLIASARLVMTCPAQLVAHLAEERSVDEFSSAWPEERQRAAVDASFALHRVKGTRPALERALAPLGYSARLTEWFESPGRAPYTFRLAVTVPPDREWLGGRTEIIRVANQAKNAHTQLEQLDVRRQVPPALVHIGAHLRRVRTLIVKQQPFLDTLHLRAAVWVGVAQTRHRTLIIGPRP